VRFKGALDFFSAIQALLKQVTGEVTPIIERVGDTLRAGLRLPFPDLGFGSSVCRTFG
jgi:hypothetical protein